MIRRRVEQRRVVRDIAVAIVLLIAAWAAVIGAVLAVGHVLWSW